MNQKKCPDCSTVVPAGAKFCPDCGAPLTSAPAKDSPKKDEAKKSHGARDTIIIVAALVVIVGSFYIFSDKEEPPKPPQQQQQSATDQVHGGMSMDEMMANLGDIPEDFNGLVQAGNKFMDANQFPMAAECYKRALVLHPEVNDVRVDFGACLHFMGLDSRALEEFYTVTKEQPDHPIANFNLGIVYYGMNQMDSAKFYWDHYLKLEPNGKAADQARGYLEQMKAEG